MRIWLADLLLHMWTIVETRDLRKLALTGYDSAVASKECWCAWCWRLYNGADAAQRQVDELQAALAAAEEGEEERGI